MFVVQHCIDYEMYTVPSNQKVVAQRKDPVSLIYLLPIHSPKDRMFDL